MCSCRAFGIPFYLGTIAPFLIIYIFNWGIFAIIMTQFIIKNCSGKFKESYTEDSKMTAKQKFIIALTLSILFGLGWGVGLFATQDLHRNTIVRDVVSSIFIILTAFQGLFIFIMHCLRSAEVRKQWKMWFYKLTCRKYSDFSINSSSFSTSARFKRTGSTTTTVSFVSSRQPSQRMTTIQSQQVQFVNLPNNAASLCTTSSATSTVTDGSISYRVPSTLDLARYEHQFGSQVSIGSSCNGSIECHAIELPEVIEIIETSFDYLNNQTPGSTPNHNELEMNSASEELSHLPNPLMSSDTCSAGVVNIDVQVDP